MCMFTFPNKASRVASSKGITKFECGGCPECLQKKSRQWALRCGMEARTNVGMMVTLTYDTYKKDLNGNDTSEENPVDTSLRVDKTHIQRFFKRLRKQFSDKKIKYLATAEYGKRTHRAHYHCLIFGLQFDDLRHYKKSKRGNIIYKSPTLEKIWSADKQHNGGICTVDCVNLSAKTARYCTKYCAKDSGVNDTFMLFSRGIGESELLRKFDGKSYWIDGREYSIPRLIWQKVIEKRYNIDGYSKYVGRKKSYDWTKSAYHKYCKIEREKALCESRYDRFNNMLYNHDKYYRPKKRGFRSKRVETWFYERERYLKTQIDKTLANLTLLERAKEKIWLDKSLDEREVTYNRGKARREIYQNCRDNDYLYYRYLSYWKRKNEIAEITRADDITRILQLSDNKYRSYKSKALIAKIKQVRKWDFIPPRSNTQGFIRFPDKKVIEEKSFAPLSRHYRANDTIDFFSKPFMSEFMNDLAREKAKKINFTKFYEENSPF